MKTETFLDGSTIDTDEETGNRTVCGPLAHREYFKRLAQEQFTASTPVAVIAQTLNLDKTPKAQLIRRVNSNPITREQFGEYGFEVWHDVDPDTVTRYASESKARAAFKSASLYATNGMEKEGA
jgi:hypothetical protein